MSENPMLAWALYYRQLGLSIFPVSGKHPMVPWKAYQTELATEEQIREWWRLFPTADIGMATGTITNRLVLDIDGPAGAASIQGLALPTTQAVRTRRGTQYHFKLSPAIGKSTLVAILPGVDVRGVGGYVKMPPSSCTDGTLYGWINGLETPLADAPAWLIEKLTPKPVEPPIVVKQDGWLSEVLDGVGMGERHQAFIKLAGYYFNCMHPDIAAQHLRDWNQKNTPPLEDLDDKIGDFTKRFKNGEYESKFLKQLEKETKLYKVVSAGELVTQYKNRINWLVEGLIPVGSTCILSGYQGLGKTFCATDLITEISKTKGQRQWLGTFSTQAGPVLYLDNEMSPYLTSYRLQQILRAKQLTTADLNLYYAARSRVKLTESLTYDKLRKDIEEIKPVLVVVDSFASCFTLDENSSKDIRYFFDELIAPLADEFQCAFLFLDHERKGTPGESVSGNRRLRGSGAKGDSVDTILSLDYKNGCLVMEQSKARYSKRHAPILINIEDEGSGIRVYSAGVVDA